jgi:membrane-associated phospholipid phosphatase
MAFGALTATTLLLMHSPLGWVPLALLPLLAWSRLVMKRHTISEVLTGLIVGVAFGFAILSV